jgi:hypothetical protein
MADRAHPALAAGLVPGIRLIAASWRALRSAGAVTTTSPGETFPAERRWHHGAMAELLYSMAHAALPAASPDS